MLAFSPPLLMPELPEVETVVRTLAPKLEGRTVTGLRFLARRVRRGRIPALAGKTIRRVHRHGKLILLDCGNGSLAIHLGMTGRLLAGVKRGPHTRAELVLGDGVVRFDDTRMFGFVKWLKEPPARLGPEPLEISAAEFAARLRCRNGRMKPLLLNQAFLRGLGNIYADEILFRSGIHPRAVASRLSQPRALRLHAAMREVLEGAIAAGGSSVSDYVDAEGRRGFFQFEHQVYQRTGEPCLVCGAPIRRIVMAQRGTHYCPRCQRV